MFKMLQRINLVSRAIVIYFLIVLQSNQLCCMKDGSLTFVIDDTGSMRPVIKQVKDAAKEIMRIVLTSTSQIKDVVLVTFNDYDPNRELNPIKVRTKTNNSEILHKELSHIYVRGGNDCPELALGGLKKALEENDKNSYVFVFTDASAKDHRLTDQVIRIAQNKSSQVTFVLSPSFDCEYRDSFSGHCYLWSPLYWGCRGKHGKATYYDQIAAATYGQVFRINDMKETTQILKHVKVVSSGNLVPLIVKYDLPTQKWSSVSFTCDEDTEYVVILVNGIKVFVDFLNINGDQIDNIVHTENVKSYRIDNIKSGTYNFKVKGAAVGIFARSDFSFDYCFSKIISTSLDTIEKEPTVDTSYYLMLFIKNNDDVIIKTAEIILTKNQEIYTELELKKISKDVFASKRKFVVPDSTFLIAVKGRNLYTYKFTRKIAKTPITPKIKIVPPKIEKLTSAGDSSDKKLPYDPTRTFSYNSKIFLACHIRASPEPVVYWTDINGRNITNTKVYQTESSAYKSVLTIDKLKHSNKYNCVATNQGGKSVESIEVKIKEPIIWTTSSKPVVNVGYGKDTFLKCNIESYLPLNTTWYRKVNDEHVQIYNSENFTISPNGLKINKVVPALEGTYVCKKTLQEDTNVTAFYNSSVHINDIVLPKIEDTEDGLYTAFMGEDSLHIPCKVVANPKARISWTRNGTSIQNDTKYKVSADGLTILNPTEEDTAGYTCRAVSELGKTEKIFKAYIYVRPKIEQLKAEAPTDVKIPDSADRNKFFFNSKIILTCYIKATPEPVVYWTDNYGLNTTNAKVYQTASSAYKSVLTIDKLKQSNKYNCVATNLGGKSVESIEVKIKQPIIWTTSSSEVVNVSYGKDTFLKCNIESYLPLNTTWYRKVNDEHVQIYNSENFTISPNGLKINKVVPALEGTYLCKKTLPEDTNVTAFYNSSVHINDIELPKIQDTEDDTYTAYVGQKTLYIPCNVVANPKANISWTKNGKDIASDAKYQISTDGLTILNPTEEDTAGYTCRAISELGKTEKTFDAYVYKFKSR